METTSQVILCPLCDNYAPQQLVHIQPCTAGGDTILGKRSFELSGACYYVAVCQTCKGVLLYWTGKDKKLEANEFYQTELVWPKLPVPHKGIPLNVVERYSDALRVKDVPTAFAVQIGLALEQICDEYKIKEGDLFDRLPKLASQLGLKTELVAITSALRLLRNKGAHVPKGVEEEYVPVIQEFFLELVDYIFVAPVEYKQKLEKLEKMRKKAEEIENELTRQKAEKKARKKSFQTTAPQRD